MKKILFIIYLSCITVTFAQQTYYNDVDLTLTGTALRDALATKIISTHTNNLSYNGAREALKITDLEPNQNNNVLLLYGFSSGICPNSASSDNDHRLRNKNNFGGGASCEWNREHTYPKSLGIPNLGTSGPGADAHHLRSCDVQRNGQRDSKKFASGSGNSGTVGSNWYPGDEWRGDVARMMMYMYLRYGNQCLPTNVAVGSTVANDSNMVALLLQWNAEDPVSTYEENRNDYLELTSNSYGQGNRNPFIDNPYLATLIWGGQDAEDIWGIYLDVGNFTFKNSFMIYPSPTKDILHIRLNTVINQILIYDNLGRLVLSKANQNTIDISKLHAGLYFCKVTDMHGDFGIKKVLKR